VAAIRGPGWGTLVIALAVGTLPGIMRFAEVRTREILAEEYILAAKSSGAGAARILKNHLWPILSRFFAVKAPGIFAGALLSEATLSYLGIGAPIGRESWGALLAQGKDYLLEAPLLAIVSGIPLLLSVLSLQLLSERAAKVDSQP